MAHLFARVANWLANEVIVKTLSENKAFQQFALRTAKKGGKVMSEVSAKAEQIKSSETTAKTADSTKQGLRSVVDWVREDLSKVGTRKK